MSMKSYMHTVVLNNSSSAAKSAIMIRDEETCPVNYEVAFIPVSEFITMEQSHFTEEYVNPDHDAADEADIAAFLAAF